MSLALAVQAEAASKLEAAPDLESYDRVIVTFSGGKDSLACLLHLLEMGVPRERIELWHHDVDGREGSRLMDWPVTREYCRAVASAFGIPIFFSWKTGGFEGEMLREESFTQPNAFETPEGEIVRVGGTSGKMSTRRRFPQVSADLRVRWCSAYLKIDVCASAINNQERFLGKKTLVVTGERAEESSARARYQTFEPHRTDSRNGNRRRRHVDQWRPIHAWAEARVWKIIERWRVAPHPAYDAGFGRVSCSKCIFSSANQWATMAMFDPEGVERISSYEEEFGVTIQRNRSVKELVSAGRPYAAATEAAMERALSEAFDEPVLLAPGEWKLPAGAFGESAGPS